MIILIGILFSIAFASLISLFCGGGAWFIDYPSLLAIIIPLAFFLKITNDGKIIKKYIKSSFIKNYQYDIDELNTIILAVNDIVKFTIATGWFGFFAGLITMLANLNRPEQLGPNLAVSLITVYYSIAIGYFVFFPVKAWAENRVATIECE